MQKVRWGILGVARIATQKVIPAMQGGELCEVVGIASRDRTKAEQAAGALGIKKAYGSYAEMLADPEIEAVYNPLSTSIPPLKFLLIVPTLLPAIPAPLGLTPPPSSVM